MASLNSLDQCLSFSSFDSILSSCLCLATIPDISKIAKTFKVTLNLFMFFQKDLDIKSLAAFIKKRVFIENKKLCGNVPVQ